MGPNTPPAKQKCWSPKELERLYSITYVRESQPDWLSVGAHRRGSVDTMRDLANGLATAEQADGNRRRAKGVVGYQGFRCGRVFWGECRGWGLLQLSGDSARAYLAPALDCADSVSRLDLAVTVQTDRPNPDLGRELYDQARDWRVTHPKAAKPWYITGDDTGWTTYIGKRSSDLYFRCYDKAAETRDDGDESAMRQYVNSWRYELELKDEPAESTARRLVDSRDVPGTTSAIVHGWLTARGVTPPWDIEQPVRPIGTLRRRSDRDRKLDWLLSQVRPTVQWLVENGDSAEVLQRLGLEYAFAAAESTLSA